MIKLKILVLFNLKFKKDILKLKRILNYNAFKQISEQTYIGNLDNNEILVLKEKISKGLEQGLEEKALMELIYKEAFELATDLELDEDLIESINKGKKELMFIAQDIDEIVSEIVIEAMLEKQNLLANMTSLTLSKRILLEAEKLEILNKQCEKLEEEIKEMKKGD